MAYIPIRLTIITQNSIFSIEILNKMAGYFICGYSISNILIFCRASRKPCKEWGNENCLPKENAASTRRIPTASNSKI